jgi:hypothetical protein
MQTAIGYLRVSTREQLVAILRPEHIISAGRIHALLRGCRMAALRRSPMQRRIGWRIDFRTRARVRIGGICKRHPEITAQQVLEKPGSRYEMNARWVQRVLKKCWLVYGKHNRERLRVGRRAFGSWRGRRDSGAPARAGRLSICPLIPGPLNVRGAVAVRAIAASSQGRPTRLALLGARSPAVSVRARSRSGLLACGADSSVSTCPSVRVCVEVPIGVGACRALRRANSKSSTQRALQSSDSANQPTTIFSKSLNTGALAVGDGTIKRPKPFAERDPRHRTSGDGMRSVGFKQFSAFYFIQGVPCRGSRAWGVPREVGQFVGFNSRLKCSFARRPHRSHGIQTLSSVSAAMSAG